MDLIDIRDFLLLPNFYFKWVGMEPYKDSRFPINYILRKAVLWISGIEIFTTIILESIFLVNSMKSSSLLEVTALAPCTGFCIIGAVKFVTILLRQKDIRKFFRLLSAIFPKTAASQNDAKLTAYLRTLTRMQKTFVFQVLVSMTVFGIAPLMVSLYEVFRGAERFQMRYSFFLWYPFEISTYHVYFWVMVQQAHAGQVTAICEITGDLLMFSMVYLMCMHFEYIAKQITAIQPTGHDEDIGKLAVVIKQHQMALDLSKLLNDIFSVVILSNFLISSFIICLTMFQATVSGWSDVIKYLVFLIFETIMIFLTCYFADLLITSSNKVAEAAFNSNWLQGNLKYRKSILLIILRGQKPAVMTAQGFSIVSLRSFTNIMSTSYQFFALLRKLYKK